VVLDIREQYLLPLEATQEIAERLGIKHPTDPKTGESVVMTSDFLIDVQANHHVELKARTIKSANELSSKRKIEKLEIERTYWKEQGVDWGIVMENEIPEAFVKNVKWVHSARDRSNSPGITPKILIQKGAAALLMPISSRRQLFDLPDEMATKINIEFYADAAYASAKAIID